MFKLIAFPIKLLTHIFGSVQWKAPTWIQKLTRFIALKQMVYRSILIILLILTAAYSYLLSLPQPIQIKPIIYSPVITGNYEGAEPDTLLIDFKYMLSASNNENNENNEYDEEQYAPVARLKLVGEEIVSGIHVTPRLNGKWYWEDDSRIRFEPENDWPAGVEYSIEFEASIFQDDTHLTEDEYQFTTPDFTVEIIDSIFYQDPTDISIRRVNAQLLFSHPVDKDSLENNLSMLMSPNKTNASPTAYEIDISYNNNLREASVWSKPVTLPSEPNYMKINLAADVKTILGGKASTKSIEDKVLIPDVHSFLNVASVVSEIVKNSEGEPEQVIIIEFTDDIEQEELLNKLSVYRLPENNQLGGRRYWQGPREVTESDLVNSTKVAFTLIPNERNFSKFYSLKIDEPEQSYIYIKMAPGFTSVNKFIHASFYDQLLTAPSYPREVEISGSGSVLTYSGEHKLSVLSRGIPALKYSIGRLLEGEINHLITQTEGDISDPSFKNWSFNETNITEVKNAIVDLPSIHPKEPNYSSIDLSSYLPNNSSKFGLFFINVTGWDWQQNREIYDVNDTRLVLITDLGLIVKDNADRSHQVFVQSIQSGLPVAGASVELLGKNGIAIFKAITSVEGEVSFPSTLNFNNERQPTVYVVKTKNDISFIPFQSYSRQINLSKFDIGGVYSGNNQSLNAFAFTDRGIYRPGEKINVGFVVKSFDFSNIENIPLEVVVRGPRYNEVKVKKLVLPEKGFFDFNFLTEDTSDTGRYNISLHLIRDNKYRGKIIGSTSFKVEEFQPDTMKIVSKLVDVPEKGWANQEQLSVNVSLQNLFGLPAQNRKLTGNLIIEPTVFNFKKFKNYSFSNAFHHQENNSLYLDEQLENQQTDADGLAHFKINLKRFSEGTYRLKFEAEGFDQAGGRSVHSFNSALISPLKLLVGAKVDGKLDYIHVNSTRTVEFIAIDNNLKKLAKKDLTLKTIEIQTVSTLVKLWDDSYKYQTVEKETELSTKAFEIIEHGQSHILDSSSPGSYAIEIIDNQNKVLSRLEYTVVGYGNLSGKIDKNAELQIQLNKDDYEAGELIEISIKAPYAGAGLISIETDRVHNFKWFKTDVESTIQTIEVPENIDGTAYLNVAFVRDVSSKAIFTSPLSYAVKPFSIDKSKRKIDVSLDADEIVRPGQAMKINYRTSLPSKIALFAVDEGILQVAQYQQPDPLGHFLKKRSLGVQTLQIMDLILPEFKLLKELSASGGGSQASKLLAKNLNPFSRKTDKPAVFWSGIHDAGPETKAVTFDVPNTFAGNLRIMAVAVADEAVGSASESTLVRGPFVISPNILTQASPGDEFMVTVGISNIIEGSGKDADVALAIETSKHLKILGETNKTLKISEGDEGSFTIKVKATELLGQAEIRFVASHKNETTSRTTSLSIRPAMPYTTNFESGFNNSGTLKISSLRNLYGDLSERSVSASSSPLVLVDGLTSYLKHFPHGCTEQVVSKVFPLIGLLNHPSYGAHVPEVQTHFNHVIDKLRERQLADGSFAFWPGAESTAEYPSVYVMHFLIEAMDLGYPVPKAMIERGKDYLETYAGKSSHSLNEAKIRANAIYLLTRLGEVTTNYVIDLEDYLNKQYKNVWPSNLLASYMAATYQLLQKTVEANRLIAGYSLGELKQIKRDDFHSQLTEDAQYIYLLSKHFESKAKTISGDEVLKLTVPIFKGQYNTISAAYTILALGAYSQLVAVDEATNENISISAISSSDKNVILNALATPFLKASYSNINKSIENQSNKIKQLQLSADNPFYYLNVQSGFDKKAPKKSVSNGIEITRDFFDDNGKKITSFEQGKTITVRLKVRALDSKMVTNVAVIDLLPGGFEVIRSSVARNAYNWQADYVDIREDRIIYYGDFDNRVRELSYKVKLTSVGEFNVPPSYAASMYDRSISAFSKAGEFTVTASE